MSRVTSFVLGVLNSEEALYVVSCEVPPEEAPTEGEHVPGPGHSSPHAVAA